MVLNLPFLSLPLDAGLVTIITRIDRTTSQGVVKLVCLVKSESACFRERQRDVEERACGKNGRCDRTLCKYEYYTII